VPAAIDFYFDFSSPYGYLASERIEAIAAAHGRNINWRPILLGPAFKASGNVPLVGQPLKGEYAVRDFARTARFLQIPFRLPEPFPIGTQNAARAFYWLHDRDPALAAQLVHALYRTYFAEGRNITAADTVVAVAANLGVNSADLAAALADEAVKARLKREVEDSLAGGVFGSPYIVADGEPFWGHDRLDQLDAWLRTGGG